MKDKKKITIWERYLTKEIGIEFKACLYFFAILFFYCVYRMTGGIFEASMLHMGEMILTCYAIGYIQVYLLWNFDEAERMGIKECLGILLCTCIYCLVSFIGNWFDRKLIPTLLLAVYLIVCYICVFVIYRSKRRIDDKKLNEDLRLFQTKHKKE
jgi:hypothetical protein